MRKGQVEAPFEMLITTIMFVSVLFIGMNVMAMASGWMETRKTVAEVNKLTLDLRYVDNAGPGTIKSARLTVPNSLLYIAMFSTDKGCGACTGYETGCVLIMIVPPKDAPQTFCAGIPSDDLGSLDDPQQAARIGINSCKVGAGLSKEKGIVLKTGGLDIRGGAYIIPNANILQNKFYCFLPGDYYLTLKKGIGNDDNVVSITPETAETAGTTP